MMEMMMKALRATFVIFNELPSVSVFSRFPFRDRYYTKNAYPIKFDERSTI